MRIEKVPFYHEREAERLRFEWIVCLFSSSSVFSYSGLFFWKRISNDPSGACRSASSCMNVCSFFLDMKRILVRLVQHTEQHFVRVCAQQERGIQTTASRLQSVEEVRRNETNVSNTHSRLYRVASRRTTQTKWRSARHAGIGQRFSRSGRILQTSEEHLWDRILLRRTRFLTQR